MLDYSIGWLEVDAELPRRNENLSNQFLIKFFGGAAGVAVDKFGNAVGKFHGDRSSDRGNNRFDIHGRSGWGKSYSGDEGIPSNGKINESPKSSRESHKNQIQGLIYQLRG